ncbi:MAG: penicillin-binding protein 2 [Rickettsiaceae bacterium H1]|nr:penicillin-binding protein 2 [Rickettsiaceae bacterium H1]
MSKKKYTRRLFVLGTIKTSAILCLVGRLYYLQIIKNQEYKALSDHNRLKVSLINAARGNIFDRNGKIIAYNKKQYDLVFSPVKGIDVDDSITKLLHILELSQSEYHNLYTLIRNAKEATVISENVGSDVVRKLELNSANLHGIFIVENYERHYPFGMVLAHVIGYARKNYHNGLYLYIGESGVEYSYDKDLNGSPGILQEEINAKMEVVRSLSRIVATEGKSIELSIGYELQYFISNILKHTGSVVLLDVKSGNVMAMNSYPSYDNNLFVKSISRKQWGELKNDARMPLFHRAVALQIPPGSTFKLISALAALESGIIDSESTFFCSGRIKIGNNVFRCWKKQGHGLISLNEAISSSCNVYFYYIGQKLNVDFLFATAIRLGFGQLTGIGLKEEQSGIIPDSIWRKKKNYRNWYVGDTINSVIGHGYVLVTPLQLAVMTARLATGKKIIPSLEKNVNQINFDPLKIDAEHLKSVKYGMYSAVNSFSGTANKVYSGIQKIAGKTGTAQTVTIINGNKVDHDHSLFVGYAPYNKPKYAISVVMENSISGSASRIAKQIFDYIFAHDV